MKKSKFLLPLTAFALLLSFGLAACNNATDKGGDGAKESEPQQQESQKQDESKQASSEGQPSSAKQEKITVTAAGDKTKLMYGETVQLTASVEGVTWTSSKPEIASVDGNGLVSALAKGSASIKASKEGFRDGTISISVDYPSITITASGEKDILVGGTVTLTASEQGVTWTSSDPEVATVNNGVVTGVKLGSATIKASKEHFNDGSVEINVVRPAPTAQLHWEDADHYAADGEWASSNNPYESPVYDRSSGNASDNTCIAHFGEGDKETLAFTSNVAVKAEFVMTIASRSAIDDLSAVMAIKLNNVDVALTGAFEGGSSSEFAELSLGELDIIAGDNALEISFLSSSAPYIDDLNIYAVSAATIALKPAPVRERITVQEAELTVEAGKTVQIVVTKPTSLDGVSFTSSDESAATVDQTGLVTGVSLGSAKIIVRKEGMNPAIVSVSVTEHQELGEIRLEAELAEEVVDGSSNFMALTDGTSGITRPHSGGGYISGYRVSGEEPLTFKFTATDAQAGKYELSVNGSAAYQATEDFMFATSTTITLNGVAVTINADAAIVAGDGGMSAPRVDATLGEVDVIAGENTLVVTFNGKAPSLDFFRLVPKA